MTEIKKYKSNKKPNRSIIINQIMKNLIMIKNYTLKKQLKKLLVEILVI